MQDGDTPNWRRRLEDIFTHNGSIGGRSLPSLVEQEGICGAYFRDREPDYRVLADSFCDFFATTLGAAASAYHDKGWPDHPCYGLCVIEFVAQFRGFRAAEILSANGYPFDGCARLRELKDQAIILGAIAGGRSSFPALYGCEAALSAQGWDELAQAGLLRRSVEQERTIFSWMMGGTSGLDAATIAAIGRWNDLFNLKIDGKRSITSLEMKAWSENRAHFSVGPRIDNDTGALYARGFVEIAWMTLRTLPFLQTEKVRFTENWGQTWGLLDQSMRLAVEAAAGPPDEPTSSPFITMIDAKFSATPQLRYAERG